MKTEFMTTISKLHGQFQEMTTPLFLNAIKINVFDKQKKLSGDTLLQGTTIFLTYLLPISVI